MAGAEKAKTVKGRGHRFHILLRYALLITVGSIFIFPLVFMIVSSLKPDLQLLRDSGSLLAFVPHGDISLQNYFDAFERVPLARFMFNSVFVTVVTVFFSLLLCSLAGFAFAILRWPGKNIVLAVLVATLIIPFDTISVPLLLLVNELPMISRDGFKIGWLDTYHVQIVPFIADAFTVFLFTQFFRDLPKEIIEAARIDGASWFQIYRRVVVPISGPVFATAAILKFLHMYNQYLWPLMTSQTEEFRPVMVGVQYFFQLNVAWGEIMAYLSFITIPVLIFYLFLQRAFIESIASSGDKG